MTDLEASYARVMEHARKALANSEAPDRALTVVAVSKTQPVHAVETLYHAGHRDFGENYVQELVEKARSLERLGCSGIRWHYIGHLQTNKVKTLLPWIHAIHTVDSKKLGAELSKRAPSVLRGPPVRIFIEVNIDEEAQKSGVLPDLTGELAEFLASDPLLQLEGLMCIPRPVAERTDPAEPFRLLKEIELACRPYTRGALSMGMSDDYVIAIEKGATHVRVGTAIFGKRK